HTVVAPEPRRHRRPPAATYGKGAASSSRSSDSEGDESPPPQPNDDDARPGGMAAAAAAFDGGGRDLVARPPQLPVTSKPFNPFGVAEPATSMEIRRSDSFFDAADQHNNNLSRESSAGKRQPSEDRPDARPGKKHARVAGRDRVQAKMSVFAFKPAASSGLAAGSDDESA
ncbi:hypothetical protein H4R19_003762, partial [Coemansia spiralis]